MVFVAAAPAGAARLQNGQVVDLEWKCEIVGEKQGVENVWPVRLYVSRKMYLIHTHRVVDIGDVRADVAIALAIH